MDYLVQGDIGTDIQATITRKHDGSVVDLTSATATLKLRKRGTTTVFKTLTNVSSAGDKALGLATFTFGSGDLDIDEGYYEGELSVSEDGNIETVYEIYEFHVREDF